MLAPYPQLIKAGYRRYAGYRQAALAGMTTNVVFGLLRVAVLSAVLAERGSIAGYVVETRDIAATREYVRLAAKSGADIAADRVLLPLPEALGGAMIFQLSGSGTLRFD